MLVRPVIPSQKKVGVRIDKTTCCIVGGGPAGVVAGLLLARQGADVLVLEKHGDFLRDFRGDTVHPSTLELIHELGWIDEFLQLPHTKMTQVTVDVAGIPITFADFRKLNVRCPYVAFMPQDPEARSADDSGTVESEDAHGTADRALQCRGHAREGGRQRPKTA
jgi:hypothetical protein